MQCICNTDLGSLFCKAYVIIVLGPQLYKSEVDNCGVFLCLAGAGAGPATLTVHTSWCGRDQATPSSTTVHGYSGLYSTVQCTVQCSHHPHICMH